MDLYLKVRQAHFQDGLSGRQIARDFGISRDSVAKMLAYSEPPGYRRVAPIKRPKLDAFICLIDQWLAEDKARPRKQRHTAKRIFERLRDECGFDGGYTIVKDYIRSRKRSGKEMFVPLSHPPGHAQADFGEALVVIGGVEQKAHFFAFDLPHSDACYIRAYPRQHELALALREIGKIERTLFIIDWLLDADMQRRAQIGLNKGEAHHALKNALRIGRQGEIRDRTAEGQHYRMAGLNLLAAIIIYWNTKHLGHAVAARTRAGLDCSPDLLSHISPLGWAHILLTGEYRWKNPR